MYQRKVILGVVLIATMCLVSACSILPGCGNDGCYTANGDGCPGAPMRVCSNPTMMALAADLDSLQRHIEEHGSVVAKQADVWGQARMTKHREDFERIMAQDLTTFELNLQGALSRSDQAYFANALALSAAATGAAPTMVPPSTQSELLTTTETTNKKDNAGTITQTRQPFVQAPQGTTPPLIQVDPGTLISSPTDGTTITRIAARGSQNLTLGMNSAKGLSLEPSIILDQKKRYLDHLNEIRRTNEGDDRADSPGYALHLVRLPVSVLPGRKTEQGYGAEITFSIKPHLSDALLPTTFRNLVVNDVMDQLAFPITKLLNDEKARDALEKYDPFWEKKIKLLDVLIADIKKSPPTKLDKWRLVNEAFLAIENFAKATPEAKNFADEIFALLEKAQKEQVLSNLAYKEKQLADESIKLMLLGYDETSTSDFMAQNKVLGAYSNWLSSKSLTSGSTSEIGGFDTFRKSAWASQLLSDKRIPVTEADFKAAKIEVGKIEDQPLGDEAKEVLKREIKTLQNTIEGLTKANLAVFLPANRQRTARFAMAPSQLKCVIGEDYLRFIMNTILSKMKNDLNERKLIHFPDVQGLLQEEVIAAHAFLTAHESLWCALCTQTLAQFVRQNDCCAIDKLRCQFHCEVGLKLPQLCKSKEKADFIEALAWCVLVESALLNQQLVEDIKETAISKGCPELRPYAGVWHPYFLPSVTGTPNEAFQAYVRCRWPIQVFALDPVTQDQNIADRFSARREMQLAMSLAFVSGNMSARNLSRYARRIEIDMDTIDLNRTAVGFSHGDATFGWRFYPRFQSPDIESNLKVMTRDLWLGGPSREALLKQRRMEPGPRECMALVIMPSFVPYATLDSTSNWFELTNPKHKVMDHKDAMQLSRAVKKIQTCSGTVNDQQCYRDGEWERLVARANQLETRLPTQTMMTQVPYENTLGGFEMFNNGITDLAPELNGFYGEPGIKAEGTTSLFLVGNHFSVLQTKVIVGGQEVIPQMLSRQVMMVKVNGVATDKLTVLANKNIDVHIATPYGVSRHLEIPLVPAEKKEEAKATGFTWKEPATLTAKIVYNKKDPKKITAYVEDVPDLKEFVVNDASKTVNKFANSVNTLLKFTLVGTDGEGVDFPLGDIPPDVANSFSLKFQENKSTLPFDANLRKVIEAGLTKAPQSKNVVLVKMVGSLKFVGDVQPITKIDPAIIIKVKVVEAE